MSQRLKTISAAVAVFAANLWVAKELLTSAFIDQMGSIEGTHIALGRFIQAHWPDLFWFPLWYGGVPYQNAYLPLHPFAVAATAGLFGISPAQPERRQHMRNDQRSIIHHQVTFCAPAKNRHNPTTAAALRTTKVRATLPIRPSRGPASAPA